MVKAMNSGLEMRYFVLKPRAKKLDDPYAAASQSAMFTYADNIEDHNNQLAEELRTWAAEECIRQARINGESDD